MEKVFMPADILLPRKNNKMNLWSVVACDQYTSDADYWKRVEKKVGEEASTLKITLPEIYLEEKDWEKRIDKINETMKEYLESDLFETLENCYIYVERSLSGGKTRKGLVGMVDLEKYDFSKGSQSEIRATEGTVLERIPPRVKIRENAPLELPHIMILIDDINKTVIEPLSKKVSEKVYDFELMENGGKIKGYKIYGDSGLAKEIEKAIAKLESTEEFDKKYGIKNKSPLPFAVGDGNHSLATAKTCWEKIKKTNPDSPARYALVEIVNLHDDSLEFEAIHRNVFEVNPENLLNEMKNYFSCNVSKNEFEKKDGRQYFTYLTKDEDFFFEILNPKQNLAVGNVQAFLDEYLKKEGRIDYIHGEDVVRKNLSESTVGFLFDTMKKEELFPTVIKDGALPRKTFSMGHAEDKRFYLEARKIK